MEKAEQIDRIDSAIPLHTTNPIITRKVSIQASSILGLLLSFQKYKLLSSKNGNEGGSFFLSHTEISNFTGLTKGDVQDSLIDLAENNMVVFDPETESVSANLKGVLDFLSSNSWNENLPSLSPLKAFKPFFSRDFLLTKKSTRKEGSSVGKWKDSVGNRETTGKKKLVRRSKAPKASPIEIMEIKARVKEAELDSMKKQKAKPKAQKEYKAPPTVEDIINHWNSLDLVTHRNTSKVYRAAIKVIKKLLRGHFFNDKKGYEAKYGERKFTPDEIKLAMSRFSESVSGNSKRYAPRKKQGMDKFFFCPYFRGSQSLFLLYLEDDPEVLRVSVSDSEVFDTLKALLETETGNYPEGFDFNEEQLLAKASIKIAKEYERYKDKLVSQTSSPEVSKADFAEIVFKAIAERRAPTVVDFIYPSTYKSVLPKYVKNSCQVESDDCPEYLRS